MSHISQVCHGGVTKNHFITNMVDILPFSRFTDEETEGLKGLNMLCKLIWLVSGGTRSRLNSV